MKKLVYNMAAFKRGEYVEYKNNFYYYQPNGKNCYLYKNLIDVGNKEKKIFSPNKTSVSKIVSRISTQKDTNSKKIGYVYIGKDIEDPRSLYKFGRTINLKNRLRQYKTGQPNFEFIIKIRTLEYKNLESKLIANFKEYRYQNEIFKDININKIKKLLLKLGYTTNRDQIYIKNTIKN